VGAVEVDAAIEAVRLDEDADAVVNRLSGGQMARASLATALLGRPEVLILDEPTVGLDPLLRRDLWALFRSLAAGGATLVVSSHVMDEAASCDELVLLREGAIVAHATPDAIRARTGTDDMSEAFVRLIEEATG
jgi:ABC-2 type transport system ATP-binding protein